MSTKRDTHRCPICRRTVVQDGQPGPASATLALLPDGTRSIACRKHPRWSRLLLTQR